MGEACSARSRTKVRCRYSGLRRGGAWLAFVLIGAAIHQADPAGNQLLLLFVVFALEDVEKVGENSHHDKSWMSRLQVARVQSMALAREDPCAITCCQNLSPIEAIKKYCTVASDKVAG